jgi:hypothetical protein
MNSESTLSEFQKFTDALVDSCKNNPSVVGLVLVGSTAETFRVDEWSDHDFFVITHAGEQEALRQDLTWLPHFDHIAFSFRETEHGLKVVYESGAVLEFAIFDCDELRACGVNHHKLAFGTKEVEDALAVAASRLTVEPSGNMLSDFRHFLSVILIGVGRSRRGEILTAGQGIRSYAAGALMKVFTRHLGPDERLDQLDPLRRFESVYPKLGNQIADALASPPEPAARHLLAIAEEHLSKSWIEYPSEEVNVIKNVLGWAP